MAREFSKSEIIRQKCSICGNKNKKFTEILHQSQMCGYILTCCNCGHVDRFYDESKFIDVAVGKGREICIQVTTCNNKRCKYYKKYSLHYSSDLLEKILNGLSIDCVKDGNCDECEYYCMCPNSCHNKQNSNDSNLNNEIKFSDSCKLDINGYKNNNPKFH